MMLGGLLFVADAARRSPPSPQAESAAQTHGSTADGVEIEEDLLRREARRRGVHRLDALVRRRLLRNMQFAETDDARDPGELLEEAYALGMDRSDPVVSRRLVQAVQLHVQQQARGREPTEEELEEWLAAHADRFARRARVRLCQVYVSRDRRGASLARDAQALLARLRVERPVPEAAAALGDPLPIGNPGASRSEQELARDFGARFARDALAAEPGRWAGPLASAYGLHLVWIHERIPGAPAELDAVRPQVREELLAARGQERLRGLVGELRRRAIR